MCLVYLLFQFVAGMRSFWWKGKVEKEGEEEEDGGGGREGGGRQRREGSMK